MMNHPIPNNPIPSKHMPKKLMCSKPTYSRARYTYVKSHHALSIYVMTCLVIFIAMVSFSTSAVAVGKIIAQSEAAEADKISVTLGHGQQTGTAHVTGCEKCPLELDINNRTRFLYNNEQIPPGHIRRYSGTSGTVIYDQDQNRVIRIHW